MGAGIHAVMQREIKGAWRTIDFDVIQACSTPIRSSIYPFMDNYATSGYPDGFDIVTNSDGNEYHKGFWMGAYGQCHITLQDFCAVDLECYSAKDNMYIEHLDDDGDTGTNIIVMDMYSHPDCVLRSLQMGYQFMHFEKEKYRLVVGFDS